MGLNHEKESDEYLGYPTARGIDGYSQAFGMTREKFLTFLTHHGRVLDVGAGGGLLAKEIYLINRLLGKNNGAAILSLDRLYGSENGMAYARYATHLAFTNLGIKPTQVLINEVNAHFEQTLVDDSYFNMSSIPDGSVDVVLACYSYGIYAKSIKQLITAISESHRVLTPRGVGLITVAYDESERMLYSGSAFPSFYYALSDVSFAHPILKTSSEGYYLMIK